MSHLLPGTVLNRNCYKITSFIAQGGFGITYLAEEIGYFKKSGFDDDEYVPHRHSEKVVVKELYYNDYCQREERTGLVNISNTEKRVEFEKLVNKQLEEGKILRRLNHPNIIRTRDIFKENGTAYMVMDFVESANIDELVQKTGRLQKRKAFHYIGQVLQAVNYIHDRKILHLDITPGNILVKKDTDEAMLIDFGASLAYGSDNKAKNNTSKLITGMKKYFAPVEQADIDNLKQFDATFDTYAVGATLYYMLTGKLPPPSSLVITGKEKIIPPSVLSGGDQLNEFVDIIVLKALAPKFYDRISTAAEFSQMLEKDGEYVNKINLINQLLNKNNYDEAAIEVNNAIRYFNDTETLKKLRTICEVELEKKRKSEEIDWNYRASKNIVKEDQRTKFIGSEESPEIVTFTPPSPEKPVGQLLVRKKVLYSIIGAAIIITAGFFIVNSLKEKSSGGNNDLVTPNIKEPEPEKKQRISTLDLGFIEKFSKLEGDAVDAFKASDYAKKLCAVIENAPAEQVSEIDYIGEFTRKFCY